MIVPDANLLLYAYDSESPFSERAREWWAECLNGTMPVGLTHPVIFAFLRISTMARVFRRPLSLDQAAGEVESWCARRVVVTLLPDRGHKDTVISLLRSSGSAGGNLVTDAQIAALALSHKGTVHTADQDFRRFPGLRCRFPLDSLGPGMSASPGSNVVHQSVP